MTLWGTPVHPALVHLPIGLFLGAWVLHVHSRIFKNESIVTAAMAVYAMAAVFVLPACLTGLLEQNRLHLNHPLVNTHRNAGLALLGISWLALGLMRLFRNDAAKARLVFACACWMSAGVAAFAGYLGGEMVYHYGLGVAN